MRHNLWVQTAILATVVSSCAGMRTVWKQEVHKRATFDLNCPQEQVEVSTLSEGSINSGPVFGARGCGKRATYGASSRVGVYMNSPVSDEGAQ